eukprot:scaffold240764_cov38-Prasinocladus_malaysianus.AAC.1
MSLHSRDTRDLFALILAVNFCVGITSVGQFVCLLGDCLQYSYRYECCDLRYGSLPRQSRGFRITVRVHEKKYRMLICEINHTALELVSVRVLVRGFEPLRIK